MNQKKSETRRKAFIREYLKDHNGKQAAIRAGYSKSGAEVTASRLLSKGKVREEVEKRIAKAEDKAIVDLAFVLKGFKDLVDICSQKIPIVQGFLPVTDENGNKILRVVDAAGANKALECLGKHLGAFIEKHELSGPNGAPLRLENLIAGSFEKEDKDE